MRRAKVRSTYGGRGRKRNRRGEGLMESEVEYSSKRARMRAKARLDELRAKKALSIVSNIRTMVTRSMAMKLAKEKKDEILETILEESEMLFENNEEEEEEKNDDDKTVEEVQPQQEQQEEQQQQPVDDGVVLEKKGDDGGLLNLDEWPMTWTYEEEWSWFKVGYECGWYSYWETLPGDFWAPKTNNKEAVWKDIDLWNFNDNNEIPKP